MLLCYAVIRNPYGGWKWHLYHSQALTHFRLITFSVKGKRALPQPQYYYFCLLLQHYIHTIFLFSLVISRSALIAINASNTHCQQPSIMELSSCTVTNPTLKLVARVSYFFVIVIFFTNNKLRARFLLLLLLL